MTQVSGPDSVAITNCQLQGVGGRKEGEREPEVRLWYTRVGFYTNSLALPRGRMWNIYERQTGLGLVPTSTIHLKKLQ